MTVKFLQKRINLYVFALVAILIESFASVFQKLASREVLLSVPFIVLYGCAVAVMMIYAIMWQFILEKLSLTTAYMRKGISYILVLIWAKIIFYETITIYQIIGMIIIIIGMVISVYGED